VSNPAHGQLARNTDGSFTYEPTANWSGTNTLTQTVSDEKLSTTATVILNVLKTVTVQPAW